MKVEELRIGNLVNIGGEINKIELVDFVDIYEHKTLFHYQPIPLTDEWLIKLGFETDGVEWWNSIIVLGIFKDGLNYLPTEEIHYRVGQEFKYVHQLQNLHYAITEDELNVLK
jgi:hypothetical protein